MPREPTEGIEPPKLRLDEEAEDSVKVLSECFVELKTSSRLFDDILHDSREIEECPRS